MSFTAKLGNASKSLSALNSFVQHVNTAFECSYQRA